MTVRPLPGRNYPLGATLYPGGVNFSVFSRSAELIELVLFDREDATAPDRIIRLDRKNNRTFHYWHVFVPNIGAGQLYGYRAYGPRDPDRGLYFDGNKVLIDPYARCATGVTYDRAAAIAPGDNCHAAYKSVVVDRRGYNWEGDEPLRLPYARSLIYELHVGGFTRHPSSGVAAEKRGTYAGLVEKIPYLKDLGVTAIELMPVQEFDPTDAPNGLPNYWGYSPVALFAPHRGYSSRKDVLGPVYEFREMVKAMHRAGIEVILDVVFNHTAEGDHRGPTLSFRGLENADYYMVDPNDQARYANYTGCGNTLNANHSVVRRLILDCLRYWVEEMHVDGFRFDLASVMARDETGQPLQNPPVLRDIESDPILASTKIIAEAWDAAGLYQVGSFVGHRWAEWNGKFRDDVRRFLKGDPGTVASFAQRLAGSPDLYYRPGRDPNRSVNFVTCHDGFTLNDLVSYNRKHNEANLEENRDGADENFSWNSGAEGDSRDPEINALRLRQIKNFITVLLISQGTPMLLMGDEARRTQHGNNNAFCHDSELSWFDWRLIDEHADLHRFVRHLIRFTQSHPMLQKERFWVEPSNGRGSALIWHGVRVGEPDGRHDSHTIAMSLHGDDRSDQLHMMVNAYWEGLEFELPPVAARGTWHRLVDTGAQSPRDICPVDETAPVTGSHYHVGARSIVVLVTRDARSG